MPSSAPASCKRHQCVIDGAASDSEVAEHIGEVFGHLGREDDRRAEAIPEEEGSVGGGRPEVARKPGQH